MRAEGREGWGGKDFGLEMHSTVARKAVERSFFGGCEEVVFVLKPVVLEGSGEIASKG